MTIGTCNIIYNINLYWVYWEILYIIISRFAMRQNFYWSYEQFYVQKGQDIALDIYLKLTWVKEKSLVWKIVDQSQAFSATYNEPITIQIYTRAQLKQSLSN